MKKKGGEDQDTKSSLIDDVYLQVYHVEKIFNMRYAFHCLFTDLQGPVKRGKGKNENFRNDFSLFPLSRFTAPEDL